ncbi:MAG: hypothetical protein WA888_16545 [Burkholderiaceae bacterium]
MAYVPLGSANQVIGIEVDTNKFVSTYPDLVNPHGLVATPDGEYLIAGSLSETPAPPDAPKDAPTSNLYLVHIEHGHVMMKIPVAGWTHHQAITVDGRYVLSTHPTRANVSVVDLVDKKVAKIIKTGATPNYTLISADGKFAYVSNTGDGTLSEIDLNTWQVSRTLDAGPSPEHMAFAPDQASIFVGNDRAGTVTQVSIQSGKVMASIDIGGRVHGVDIGDDGKTLFVSNRADGELVAVNTESGKRRVLTLTPEPYHLDAIRGNGKLYVSSSKSPQIWVVDQATLRLIETIKLPGGQGHQTAVVH